MANTKTGTIIESAKIETLNRYRLLFSVNGKQTSMVMQAELLRVLRNAKWKKEQSKEYVWSVHPPLDFTP